LAPVNASWALENRSVAIRIKGLAGAGLHVENRVPCGASNPYLVGAAAIAAGLDGIRNQIEPPPATEGLAYGLEDGPMPIPTRLEAALDELEKDTTIRGLMGEELIHLFWRSSTTRSKRRPSTPATTLRRLDLPRGRLRGRRAVRVPLVAGRE
jgi:glutamine synthetase